MLEGILGGPPYPNDISSIEEAEGDDSSVTGGEAMRQLNNFLVAEALW